MGREPRLTEAELEIMNVLWDRREATVHEVIEGLGDGRAYTTVSTLVRILEQKGHVTSRKDGRRHLYAPAVPREAVEAATVRDLVQRVFGGSPGSLVRRLLEAEDVTKEDLAEIRRLLDEER